MASNSFGVFAHFLTFSIRKYAPFVTLSLRRTRWNLLFNHPSSLVYSTRRSNISKFFVSERIVVQVDSSSVWATTGRMFLQFVMASC